MRYTGSFRSSKGTVWQYIVTEYGIEQWRTVRGYYRNGRERNKDVFVKPTKELKQYIFEQYGIDYRKGGRQ